MLYYNLICQADWLPLDLDTKATQRSCLFLSKNMLGIAQKVLEEGHRAQHKVTLLLDATYKLCINDWALVIAGVANKHIGQKEHLPCTECVPLGYGWVIIYYLPPLTRTSKIRRLSRCFLSLCLPQLMVIWWFEAWSFRNNSFHFRGPQEGPKPPNAPNHQKQPLPGTLNNQFFMVVSIG